MMKNTPILKISRLIVCCWALAILPNLAAANGNSGKDTLRLEMPLSINYDHNRVTPYIVIEINHQPFKVIFDTGSHGLKILKGGLNINQLTATGKRMKCSFGSNPKNELFLKGEIMQGIFSAGKLSTKKNIKMLAVDSAEYNTNNPWLSTGDSAIISSNHFRGFPAIMGVGLRAKGGNGLVNPLAQLPGNGKYIIEFPSYGNSDGKLIINPTKDDEAGFVFYQLPAETNVSYDDISGWLDTRMNGCLIVDNNTICQSTLLDTGNPDTQTYTDRIAENIKVNPGSRVMLKILPDDKAGTEYSMEFTVSAHPKAGKDAVYIRASNKPKNIFGTMLFFNFDVLYDQKNGVIGLRKKSPL